MEGFVHLEEKSAKRRGNLIVYLTFQACIKLGGYLSKFLMVDDLHYVGQVDCVLLSLEALHGVLEVKLSIRPVKGKCTVWARTGDSFKTDQRSMHFGGSHRVIALRLEN